MSNDASKPRDGTPSYIRRAFLTGAGATAAAGTLAALAPRQATTPVDASADSRFELKMVTTWPKHFPGLGTSADRLAERITAGTGGSVTVKVYGAGELVPALGAFDAVQQGNADMYHGAEYYWQGKSKAFAFFAAVPFGLTGPELSAWIRWGGGQELWDELSARYNIKAFLTANSGTQMGGWYKRPLETLEDFKGLKVRMPGLGGEVLRRMGAAASTIPGGEIYQALQSGRIDGTEWAGPWNDVAFGFFEIAKYYYYPGFHEPGTGLSMGINLDVWNRLSPAQQSVIESSTTAEVEMALAEFNAENARAYQDILAMPDITVAPFPREISREISRLSKEVVAEAGQGDELSQRIYQSFSEFRERAIAYNKISELAFAQDRLLESESD
ncbi:MAG: TRAP transporter substrate-binding protein [Alphaproteobacteria bacterium]